MMRRVVIESPYGARGGSVVDRNIAYARAALRDSLLRGEAPIASHLLYTQPGVLDDRIPKERQRGIDAGRAWQSVAEASAVYQDFGITPGMEYGIKAAVAAGIPVEYRSIRILPSAPEAHIGAVNEEHNVPPVSEWPGLDP